MILDTSLLILVFVAFVAAYQRLQNILKFFEQLGSSVKV